MNQTDFIGTLEYDERVVKLSLEFAIILAPHLSSDMDKVSVQRLAERLAMLGIKRIKKSQESPGVVECHVCKSDTEPGHRTMVALCQSCGIKTFENNSG